jgi:hypothetical protein
MLFENVVEPTKPLVTAKFQLVNAYVAFGAKPRTFVAKGDSVLSYVNDPMTPHHPPMCLKNQMIQKRRGQEH